tara:strand:+ start:332 stop:1798 length:1467 start_codon:yes stop_codon:yes gene_type:complete
MRLLRLTTQNPEAIFDATFNEDFVIPKDAKIALQNISIEADKNTLTIDGANNVVSYQVSEAVGQTQVALDFGSFSGSNFQDLLTDLTNKLNQNTGFSEIQGNRRELGMEWLAQVGKQSKVTIEYEIGEFGEFSEFWEYIGEDVQRVTTAGGLWSRKDGQPASSTFEASMVYPYFIARGCGVTRGKVYTLENPLGTAEDENGFILGLSTTPLDPETVSLASFKYGLFVAIDAGGSRTYNVIRDGVINSPSAVPVGYSGDGNADNDFIEITINSGKVIINCYKSGDAGLATEIDTFDYTAGETLYPVNTFFGRRQDARMNNIKVTDSPFNVFTKTGNDHSTQGELHVPPQPDLRANDNFLNFESITVANYLGYTNQRQPQSGFTRADRKLVYVADSLFNDKVVADAFLIEMLNIPLDSYDSFVGQRKNLLAVVPESDKEGVVIYEPSTPFFIDVKNNQDLLLRNIRARVVAPDYTPFAMRGLATLTILIS